MGAQRRRLLLNIVEILAQQGLLTEEEKLKIRMFINSQNKENL
ncbi:MAG: hypothetical protein UHU19_17060 [Lachnospiraceae bacterium]|nr:hypothetical protein [Lachnospiraceae bacterium]